jgi:hypothetical protein
LVEPITVSTDSVRSKLQLDNVTVSNNDFKDSTFIVLKEHCDLVVNVCSLYRNSGTFRGTVISILDSNSQVNITDWKFNNNNGMIGGLFYVNGNSPIYVYNSSFFSNFAISAPISYITNQGSIHFISWNFTLNRALSVGLFENIDSIVASSLQHCNFYENEIVAAAVITEEIDDRTHWINLWFAAESYFDYLNATRSILDIVVSYQTLIYRLLMHYSQQLKQQSTSKRDE